MTARLLGLALIATAANAFLCPAWAGPGAVPPPAADLDRVAYAVDGAESSHGQNVKMWRPEPRGPQGPMQISARAASDVGGGDRFDVDQNRTLGRAYLAQLYLHYGNWADAIAAYNWGMGNLDNWIRAGRPPGRFLSGVALYLRRVLRDSGLCAAGGSVEDCAAAMLGRDGGVMRVALAGAARLDRGGGREQSSLYRKLAEAEMLAKRAGGQQAALERKLSAGP